MEKEKLKELFWEILKLTLFAIGFGYVEGAVAHYLRLNFYPNGFGTDLSVMEHHGTLWVEVGREAATMLMLASVAAMAKGPFFRRFSVFVYIFAIWDMVYYAALYLFESWPKSILDWDILFLIPVPWFAPVLSPVLISMLGAMGALIVLFIYGQKNSFKSGVWPVAIIIAGLSVYMTTFIHGLHLRSFPASYNWWVFGLGTLLVLAAYGLMLFKNLKGETK